MNYNFEDNIKNDTLHHGFIVEGPHNADKKNYALGLAKAMLCKEEPGKGCGHCDICRRIDDGNHMDVIVTEPNMGKGSKVKSVKDEQIEKLQQRLIRKPFESRRNIAIIDGADTLTARAFNRLLKTLEEPPAGTVIFLLSENAENLPKTIRSRCIHVMMYAKEAAGGCDKGRNEAEQLIMMLVDGDYFYKEKQLIEEFAKDKESAYILLDAMEQVYMDMLFKRNENYGRFTNDYLSFAIGFIEEARREIQKNANLLYTLKKMALNIGG